MVAGLLAAGLLAGCGSEAVPTAAPAAPPAASQAPSPDPSPLPPALTADPFTGAAEVPTGSVVVLKIDNSVLARPFHRGFEEASLVYQELAEGGSSRFFAVYAPATATEVGPVRSLREADIELLAQFGRVVIGASGGNDDLLATFAAAEAAGQLLEVNEEVIKEPFRKAERRADAFNFYTSPAKIDATKPGGDGVRDIGLVFGALPAGGQAADRTRIRMAIRTEVALRYEPATGTYAVLQDGVRMNGFAPANVIVQSVVVRDTASRDVNGMSSPYTESVGAGAAVLLRDGVRLDGTWTRPTPEVGTRFLDASGGDLALKPGPTLLLMAPSDKQLGAG